MPKTTRQAKVIKLPKTKRKTASHHVRLPAPLEAWAEAKAATYRSVAAWMVDIVRTAYEAEQ